MHTHTVCLHYGINESSQSLLRVHFEPTPSLSASYPDIISILSLRYDSLTCQLTERFYLAKLIDDDDEKLALLLTAAVVGFQFVKHADLAAFHVEASLQQVAHDAVEGMLGIISICTVSWSVMQNASPTWSCIVPNKMVLSPVCSFSIRSPYMKTSGVTFRWNPFR